MRFITIPAQTTVYLILLTSILISFYFRPSALPHQTACIPLPDLRLSSSLPFTCLHYSPCLFISVLLCVLLSGTVIITSRSPNSFDSVSLTDPKLEALHAAANGYLINLSLQVQLGESDKLGNPGCSALLSAYRG